jgi:hypothetical protein
MTVQLLALHDGVMHRDRLVAELWPDDPPWLGQQRLEFPRSAGLGFPWFSGEPGEAHLQW